jgi:hypothetical protein
VEIYIFMEVFMKTMKQFAVAGITVFLALFLVTCGADLPGVGGEAAVEYSDWEYVVLPNGTAQLTLYLDGSTPIPSTSNNRALNHDIAKRSHDFFEAVFWAQDGTVARATWEIGQPAGIRGVRRGFNYAASGDFTTGLTPPGANPVTNPGTGRATVFVGRKASNSEGTLLAVGFLTHVEGKLITSTEPGVITGETTYVTFTVSPLETKVGFDFSGSDFEQNALGTITATPPGSGYGGRDTFWTSAMDLTSVASVGAVPNDHTKTAAGIATFRNKATFTIFNLPAYPTTTTPVPAYLDTDHVTVGARYLFGGLSIPSTHSDFAGGPPAGPLNGSIWAPSAGNSLDLSKVIFVYPHSEETGDRLQSEDNFQVIERLAIYSTLGQRYDVDEVDLDTETTVKLHSDTAHDDIFINDAQFNPEIPLEFRIVEDSGGVFAITFQVPVYALVQKKATVTGAATDVGPAESTNSVPYIKWYIRPAHQQQQYLLDSGRAAGGMVLMGVGVGSLDWIEIITKGLGFTN